MRLSLAFIVGLAGVVSGSGQECSTAIDGAPKGGNKVFSLKQDDIDMCYCELLCETKSSAEVAIFDTRKSECRCTSGNAGKKIIKKDRYQHVPLVPIPDQCPKKCLKKSVSKRCKKKACAVCAECKDDSMDEETISPSRSPTYLPTWVPTELVGPIELPVRSCADECKTHMGLTYFRNLAIDVRYIPGPSVLSRPGSNLKPALFLVPGRRGQRSMMDVVADYFASRGFVTITTDYIAPAPSPTNEEEALMYVERAFDHAFDQTDQFEIDPFRAAAYGSSWGGKLSSMLCLRGPKRFKACVNVAGGTRYSQWYTETSLEVLSVDDTPTFRILHGTADTTVLLEDVVESYEVAKELGFDIELTTYEGLGHMIRQAPDVLSDATAFFQLHLSP